MAVHHIILQLWLAFMFKNFSQAVIFITISSFSSSDGKEQILTFITVQTTASTRRSTNILNTRFEIGELFHEMELIQSPYFVQFNKLRLEWHTFKK